MRTPSRTRARLLLFVLLASAPTCATASEAALTPAPCDCSVFGSTGLVLVRSARTQTRGVLALSVGADYYESLDLSDCLGTDEAGRYTSLHLAGNYGLLDWLELSFDLPARRAQWSGTADGSENVTGLDSPVIGAKFALTPGSSVYSAAVEVRVGLPFGDRLEVGCDGGTRLTGGAAADWEVILLATADLTDRIPLRLHANVGWAFHRDEERGRRFFPDYYPPVPEGGSDGDNDALLLRGALEFPGRNVSLFTEFRGDLLNGRDLWARKENPLAIAPGVRVKFGGGWAATGAFSVAISGDDRGTPDFDPHDVYPDWEATLALAYTWPVFAADTDGDGIPDFRDACHREPEDFDGYQDEDGCPDLDNDADGIPDDFDGTPLLGEDFDGFEDDDGVPDLDNDGDGIIDERDMCPDQKEDLDGFEDEDGCPDT